MLQDYIGFQRKEGREIRLTRMHKIQVIGVLGLCLLVSAGCSISSVKAGPQFSSITEYLSGYAAEFSLREDDLRLCTPNQIIQIYCQALRYGDDSTFKVIQKNVDRELRSQYVIDNVIVKLVLSTSSDRRVFVVSLDIINNDGELFPTGKNQLSLEFTLVRDKHAWMIYDIKPM